MAQSGSPRQSTFGREKSSSSTKIPPLSPQDNDGADLLSTGKINPLHKVKNQFGVCWGLSVTGLLPQRERGPSLPGQLGQSERGREQGQQLGSCGAVAVSLSSDLCQIGQRSAFVPG